MNYTAEDLACFSCVYYERKYGCDSEEKKCILSDSDNFQYAFPCSHYIEDAKHYKERTEIKKPVKVKKLKERKNIREIE